LTVRFACHGSLSAERVLTRMSLAWCSPINEQAHRRDAKDAEKFSNKHYQPTLRSSRLCGEYGVYGRTLLNSKPLYNVRESTQDTDITRNIFGVFPCASVANCFYPAELINNDFCRCRDSTPRYSCRRASIGSRRAAVRAGK
jgi:hypothetical protein